VTWDNLVFFGALPVLAQGLLMTIQLVVASLIVGSLIGLITCTGRLIGKGALDWLSSAYVNMFRGLPETVLIFWIYYCGPFVFDVRMSAFTSGVLALSLVAGAYLGEIFRAGVLAIPRGQYEAANALGLTKLSLARDIVIPQAFKIMLPAIFSLMTILIKNSSIVSAIGVAELFYRGSILAGDTFRHFEVFTAVGMIYFALIFPLSLLSRRLERHLSVAH
jgi:His/Glu/Gln/Arg/opine family amino acid ABC transporter permease subunit